MSRIFLFLILFFFSVSLFAQDTLQSKTNKFTVSGYVKEEASGETMIAATVYIKELLKATQTNAYGFYSLTLEKGNYTLVISYLGFIELHALIILDKDLHINISLKSKTYEAKEVVIEAEKKDRNVQSINMAQNTLEVE